MAFLLCSQLGNDVLLGTLDQLLPDLLRIGDQRCKDLPASVPQSSLSLDRNTLLYKGLRLEFLLDSNVLGCIDPQAWLLDKCSDSLKAKHRQVWPLEKR